MASDIRQAGHTAVFVKTNVTSAADWKDAVDKAMAQFDKIDILVNNAGWTYRRKESLEVTEYEYDREMHITEREPQTYSHV